MPKFKKDKKDKKDGKENTKKKGGEDEFIDPNEPSTKNTFYIWWIIGFDAFWLLIGCFGAGIVGALPILLYLILGSIIDTLTPSVGAPVSDSDLVREVSALLQTALFQGKINQLSIYMTIIAAVSFVGAFLQNFFMHLAHDRIGNRVKSAYFDILLDQEIGYFDMKRVGELINSMSETMEMIQDGLSVKLGVAFQNVIQTILGVAFAINSGWKMALVMLSAAPLIVIVLGSVGGFVKVFQTKIGDINGKAAAIANEVIGSMRTVRSMDGEEREKERFVNKLTAAHFLYFLKASALGISIGFAFFFIWGVIALAFWFGGRLVIEGTLSVGSLFEVYGLILIAIIGLAGAMQALPDVGKSTAATQEVLKVIKRIPMLNPRGGICPDKIEGNITFENVNFCYPTRPNVQVLKDFNLTITPGQAVALVGASGSGKSTIVGLIEKFYAPNSGNITLDGNNLADIDPRWLHRNIGIVTQEPTLFAASIKSNITYAITGTEKVVTDEDIINAAKAANAHDFIMQLPDNYNTMLGERGVSLSGGQKQRIAIARAMIQDPKLLLLDEATSALDTESESLVQDALNRLMEGRTTIVIAHRLSTIVDSDVICVMSKGEMKEKGTHQELLKIENGYYWKLAQKQMKFGQNESESSDAESDTDEE